MKHFKFTLFFLILFCAFLLLSCAVTKKISAAEVLSKTTFEFTAVALDSAELHKDLFPKKEGAILPNPQVIAMVQNFAQGILEKEIGFAYLTLNIVAKNQSQDSLWINTFSANVTLDTLANLPLTLKDSLVLIPGDNSLNLITKFPIDNRIFKLMDVENIGLKGAIKVALKQGEESVTLNFDISKKITHEEKVAFADKARESILNNIINDWVGAFLPLH